MSNTSPTVVPQSPPIPVTVTEFEWDSGRNLRQIEGGHYAGLIVAWQQVSDEDGDLTLYPIVLGDTDSGVAVPLISSSFNHYVVKRRSVRHDR